MCNILDGKSYELFQLLVRFYAELRVEAERAGIRLDTSQIDRVVREERDLVYAPVNPTRVNRDNNPTRRKQNQFPLCLNE